MYALPAPSHGCPKLWSTGNRTQTNGNDFGWSPGIHEHIAVSFIESTITLQYCVKTRTDKDVGFDWPEGSYCIARKGNLCPIHFVEGSITWNDKKSFFRRKSQNKLWGVLPDGKYDKNTMINFCCRNDAPLSTPMMLPIDKPFVLYRYGGTCQSVAGTKVQDEFVKFNSPSRVRSRNKCTGSYPDDDSCNERHILHFCYYSRAIAY